MIKIIFMCWLILIFLKLRLNAEYTDFPEINVIDVDSFTLFWQFNFYPGKRILTFCCDLKNITNDKIDNLARLDVMCGEILFSLLLLPYELGLRICYKTINKSNNFMSWFSECLRYCLVTADGQFMSWCTLITFTINLVIFIANCHYQYITILYYFTFDCYHYFLW
jgi:hypothetical protein